MTNIVQIDSLEDPRIARYRDIRTANLTWQSGRYIAEGWLLVQRLLGSSHRAESILCEPKYVDDIRSLVTDDVPIYVVPEKSISELIGFKFHRGVLACGIRQKMIAASALGGGDSLPDKFLWGALIGIQDPENFGTILRTCAGLGIDTVFIGPQCCDPFSRRVLRTSMGTVWRLRLVDTPQPEHDLVRLQEKNECELIATTLEAGAVDLQHATAPKRGIVMLGNEGHGLPIALQQLSKLKVQIPMRLGTDSLNVAVTAGIVLYHFAQKGFAGS